MQIVFPLHKRAIVRKRCLHIHSEEALQTYKDAQQVVNVVHNAVLASIIVRLKLIVVVKG
ncbi:hypothetical protein KDA_39920 [Dictyobacter alpinus]|uniref:3'-phosphate/5'-hydroxy nucleic acid ligase n=1 Tax=Dictyobacter alpinus TaxID=2014873 RepID=A0A402BAR0_9CHLR|nr:RtcB family protein [Dictyobacter alpinus]GCE28508.1 hypothetical protein KDA_39920 [Dictyobacter alpinus]